MRIVQRAMEQALSFLRHLTSQDSLPKPEQRSEKSSPMPEGATMASISAGAASLTSRRDASVQHAQSLDELIGRVAQAMAHFATETHQPCGHPVKDCACRPLFGAIDDMTAASHDFLDRLVVLMDELMRREDGVLVLARELQIRNRAFDLIAVHLMALRKTILSFDATDEEQMRVLEDMVVRLLNAIEANQVKLN